MKLNDNYQRIWSSLVFLWWNSEVLLVGTVFFKGETASSEMETWKRERLRLPPHRLDTSLRMKKQPKFRKTRKFCAQVYWVYLSQEMIIVSSLSFLIRDPYCWGKNIGSSIENPHVLVFPERRYYHCPMARVQSVLRSFWPIGVKWTLRTHRRWGDFLEDMKSIHLRIGFFSLRPTKNYVVCNAYTPRSLTSSLQKRELEGDPFLFWKGNFSAFAVQLQVWVCFFLTGLHGTTSQQNLPICRPFPWNTT